MALLVGGLGQAPIGDEERGLFLGAPDDPLRLVVRLVDDPLALLVDPLGLADLLGDGDSKLVDQAQRGVLVEDDVVRQGELLPVRDQRLQPLDEEDDVDGRVLRSGPDDYGMRPAAGGAPSAARSASTAGSGSIARTSPPKLAISLTRLELT